MDLRHQSSAICVIMLGEEDTHTWSATKGGKHIPVTLSRPVETKKRNDQQTTYTSHYPSRPVEPSCDDENNYW